MTTPISKEIEQEFFDKLAEKLEELFPKKQCKERGEALVLNGFANVYLRESLTRLAKRVAEEMIVEEKELENPYPKDVFVSKKYDMARVAWRAGIKQVKETQIAKAKQLLGEEV